ncbi:hypothetical protein DFH07DRAFT_959609 [Mycena maculata]|uniref:Uncharacterized protein n=1 Tax=Mycena maculata TaxID=230809 RepID=A0AAD7NBP1_9AGAR|nr:hypothetical protein DFH07DRAFT_959609 [Mycena maculata]
MSTPASAPQTPEPEESTTSSLLRRIPTEKITSFIRLKTQRRDKRPPLIFPPPSWSLEATLNNGAGASDLPDDPMAPNPSEDTVPIEDAPEPQTFAQRIGTLIDSLPPPAPTKDADVGAVDPKGPPLPLSVTADSKLMRLLSSESVMNGSISLGRQSVWSMLEQLKHRSSISGAKNKDGDHKGDEREDEGVMMYGPLEPTPDSELELADSEMVLEYFDEPPEPTKAEVPAADTKPPPSPQPGAHAGKKPGSVQPSKSRKRKAKEHIHWVPSPTKISLQAMWWGYRLYLPPPVMKVLDNSHLAAVKRAAIITSALKWLLDKVPLAVLPPQVRPAVLVLKRLAPYLGYVGVFIAWSWTTIKARDKGDGVVLTATWLLPVALVPGTLKPGDFRRGAMGASKDGKPADTSEGAQSAPAKFEDTAPKGAGAVPPKNAGESAPKENNVGREKSQGKMTTGNEQ